jgi:xanthine dehydrogenase accessory factor
MGFFINICAPQKEHGVFGKSDRLIDGFDVPSNIRENRYLVVSTQGKGDSQALKAALRSQVKYFAFVGSRKKFAALKVDLVKEGVTEANLETIHVPAGLDIGAVTPDEIAFSIVAEMIEIRRRGQLNAIKEG